MFIETNLLDRVCIFIFIPLSPSISFFFLQGCILVMEIVFFKGRRQHLVYIMDLIYMVHLMVKKGQSLRFALWLGFQRLNLSEPRQFE